MKKIILTSAQMALFLMIFKDYDMGFKVENQLKDILKVFPDTVSTDVFHLTIPSDEVDDLMEALEEAYTDQSFMSQWVAIAQLKHDLDLLLATSSETIVQDHSCKIVFLLPGVVLSPVLIGQVVQQQVEVVSINDYQTVETFLADKRLIDANVEFRFLIILTQGGENHFVSQMYDFLMENSLHHVYVCCLSGCLEGDVPHATDYCVDTEEEIVWNDLGVSLNH